MKLLRDKPTTPNITIEEYFMGRRELYANEYNDQILANAILLLKQVNELLDLLEIGKVKISSGWRPPSYNAKVTGAASKSAHMTGEAVDISDPYHYLARRIIQRPELLYKTDLFLEDPSYTKTWVHLQTRATKSGKRIFIP